MADGTRFPLLLDTMGALHAEEVVAARNERGVQLSRHANGALLETDGRVCRARRRPASLAQRVRSASRRQRAVRRGRQRRRSDWSEVPAVAAAVRRRRLLLPWRSSGERVADGVAERSVLLSALRVKASAASSMLRTSRAGRLQTLHLACVLDLARHRVGHTELREVGHSPPLSVVGPGAGRRAREPVDGRLQAVSELLAARVGAASNVVERQSRRDGHDRVGPQLERVGVKTVGQRLQNVSALARRRSQFVVASVLASAQSDVALDLLSRLLDVLRRTRHFETRLLVTGRSDDVRVGHLLDALDRGALRSDHEAHDTVGHSHLNGHLVLGESRRGRTVVAAILAQAVRLVARRSYLAEMLGGRQDLPLGHKHVLASTSDNEHRLISAHGRLYVGARLGSQRFDLAAWGLGRTDRGKKKEKRENNRHAPKINLACGDCRQRAHRGARKTSWSRYQPSQRRNGNAR